MTAKRVLSAGQCGADHSGISWTLRGEFGAVVVGADSIDEAVELLHNDDFSLVLVNRVFDADGSSGVDFIRRLKADEELRSLPFMLVSNYEDAQRDAVAAGAEAGFGKASLGHPAMLERMRRFLGG